MANRGLRGADSRSASSAESQKPNRLFKTKKRISFALTLLGLGLLAWGFRYTQGPAEGIIGIPMDNPQTESVSTNVYSGKTFSIEFPGSYKPLNVEEPRNPTIELLSYRMSSALENRRVSITIKKSPPAMLGEESALLFRQRNNGYTESSAELNGKKIIKMTKNDSSEITYFIPGKNVYAIIACTSSNPRESFNQEVSDIVKTFRWK